MLKGKEKLILVRFKFSYHMDICQFAKLNSLPISFLMIYDSLKVMKPENRNYR